MPLSKSKKNVFKLFSKVTSPVKALYPTLSYTKKLNPKAKTFKPQRSLDIRRMTSLLNPGVKGLNPFAKTFSPKKRRGKGNRKTRRYRKR